MKELRIYLQKQLETRKKTNPRYSLRAFAKVLKIDPSTLNQILSGKRQCSRARADRLLQNLGLNPLARIAVMGPEVVDGEKAKIADTDFKTWPKNASTCMREWLAYAILSSFELSDFMSDVKWFAARLGVTTKEVEKAMTMLEGLKIIDRSQKVWTFQHASLTSLGAPDRKTVDFVIQSYIAKGSSYLQNLNGETNDRSSFSGATFSVAARRLPEAIAKIHAFRRELSTFLSGGPDELQNDEVYRFNIQLFPVTKDQ